MGSDQAPWCPRTGGAQLHQLPPLPRGRDGGDRRRRRGATHLPGAVANFNIAVWHVISRQLFAPTIIVLLIINLHANDTYAGVHAGPPSCFMEFDSTASKQGNFSSPGYPNNYPENMECYYTFKGQESETLRITFHEFELEEPFRKGCLNDFVDISTISVANVKQLVGRFCGTYVPIPLLTMKPRMEIIFKANHARSAKGFFGHYEFTDESFVPPPPSSNVTGCGGTLNGVGGILTSPNYPHSFPKDVDCAWLIRVDYDKHIYLRVLELQLKGSIANCGEAELVIYDGYSNIDVNPVLLKRYCGDLKYYKNTEEKTQLSRRNRIVVRLRTTVASPQRHEGEIIGFKLVWTAVTFADQCEQFTCSKSQYCVNTESGTCNTTLTKNYCIDRTLQCDGVPNCSGDDSSDEDKCRLPLLAGCGAVGGMLALALLVSLTCLKKNRPSKMEHDLDLSVANMERSLSIASRRYSMALGLGMSGMGPGMGGLASHAFGGMGPMAHGMPGHAMMSGVGVGTLTAATGGGGTGVGGACVLHNNLNNIQNISHYDDVLSAKVGHFTPDPPGGGRRHLTDV